MVQLESSTDENYRWGGELVTGKGRELKDRIMGYLLVFFLLLSIPVVLKAFLILSIYFLSEVTL